MSDTATLKVSRRKIYLAIGLIVIIAVVGVGGFLVYRHFTSPSLHINSFTATNMGSQFGWYHDESDWGSTYRLDYKFTNQGSGAANSVSVVYAFYDLRGSVVNYTQEYGTVNPNIQVTGSGNISVNSNMHFLSPTTFRIFLYDGNTLTDQAALPY